jgi:hypothetical protein
LEKTGRPTRNTIFLSAITQMIIDKYNRFSREIRPEMTSGRVLFPKYISPGIYTDWTPFPRCQLLLDIFFISQGGLFSIVIFVHDDISDSGEGRAGQAIEMTLGICWGNICSDLAAARDTAGHDNCVRNRCGGLFCSYLFSRGRWLRASWCTHQHFHLAESLQGSIDWSTIVGPLYSKIYTTFLQKVLHTCL